MQYLVTGSLIEVLAATSLHLPLAQKTDRTSSFLLAQKAFWDPVQSRIESSASSRSPLRRIKAAALSEIYG